MTLKKSIQALVSPPTKPAVLAPAPAVGARAPVRAVGRAQASTGGGGGTFGDRVETAIADRQYWPAQTFTSSDGFLVWVVEPIKTVKFTVGGGDTQTDGYLQPPAPTP